MELIKEKAYNIEQESLFRQKFSMKRGGFNDY